MTVPPQETEPPDLVTALDPVTDAERILQAQAVVRAYCGWHIAPSFDETVRVEGSGGKLLLLPSLHVDEVTAVVDEDGRAVTDFKVRRNGLLRLRSGCWGDGVEYAVTLTHGFANAPDVAGIIRALARRAPAADSGYTQVGQVAVAKSNSGAALGASLTDVEHTVLDVYRVAPRP